MPAARIVSASVQRADSLRSERSDASQANKRVSFNRDVDVKHINHPQQQQQQQQQQGYHSVQPVQHIPRVKGPAPAPPVGSHSLVDRHDPNSIPAAGSSSVNSANHAGPPFYNVYKEPTLLSEAELAQEAERIIQQVDQISCTVASPNPHLLANYETRSLERRNLAASKRNNQIQGDNGLNWSRTLPSTASSTKNQLVVNGGEASAKSGKKTKNVEQKNNILHQQQQQQQQQQQHFEKLDPIIESSPRRPQQLPIGMMTVLDQHHQQQQQQRHGHHNNRDKAPTTPPKYDSGIEMEAATSRPNVNLIVQQLTEESRQRELLRRQYQEELHFASEDPLAPRLPALNLIEPDPQFGLSHNKNLPFSYTGGVSPTRISPLRASPGGPRFTSPPPPRPELPSGKVGGGVTDVVYAQVKTPAQQQGRGRSQSPERNVYRSSNGGGADKVPAGRGKLFQFQEQQQQQQSEVIRQHLRYPIKGGNNVGGHDEEEEEEPEGPVDEEDLDAIKAKARFLFGDDGQGQQTERKLSGSSGNSRGLDTRNNNRNNVNNSHVQYNNNNNNASGGLSFKYSTLLKDQQRAGSNHQQVQAEQADRSYHHTTKILIAGNEQQQQQQQQRKASRQPDQRVFQYSDDEDDDHFNGGRGGGGVRMYQDRSVSPEPRIQPLTNRIRSLQMQQQQQQQQSSMRKSPERSYQREPESRTLPLPQKSSNQASMASTRLIQEAERGRTVVRHRTEPIIHSSRLTQFQSRYEDELDGEFEPVAPKPPLRIKKLSRERMEASPPRQTGPTQSKVAFNTVPWRHHDRSPESSPERSYPLSRPLNSSKKMPSPYRYQPPVRSSLTPSPERRISSDHIRRWNEPPSQMAEPSVANAQPNNNKVNSEPEKQEKIRRQRSKFLSVFLGSKANKSEKKQAAAQKQQQPQQQQPSVLVTPVAPAVVIKSGPAVKEVRGQAPPQVAKWSPEDEAELVRQSRSLLVKGQSHPSNQTAANNNNNNINSSSNKMSTRTVVEPSFVRKTAATSPVDPSALRYRVVTTTNGTAKDGGHRRRSSTDRTDTSESDSHVHNQRSQFKNLRQKSQSFNNLNYRPDPVVVLGEEHQHNQNRRHPDTSVQFQSSRRYPDDGGHRYKSQHQQQRGPDARPYASTNLIHQIGVESAELRDRSGSEENQQPQQQPRGPSIAPAGPLESAPPPPAATSSAAAQSRRQMRYFGDTDLESQPSRGGGYSSRYMPKAKVLRSASSAAGMGAVRRGVLNQRGRHHPVSSVNSSESDGSAMQSAAGSAESQRSVYLHATTVADIPVTGQVHGRTAAQQLQAARRHKAQSREDMSALSGATGSTLRRTQTRQISRSYSVLAPWKPRHYRDKYEITYSNQQQPGGQSAPAMVIGDVGKPPRAPVRRREDVIVESEDSAEVYRPSAAVGQRQTAAAAAGTATATSSKSGGTSVSRSSTMPKNSKLMAGWFRKKKR